MFNRICSPEMLRNTCAADEPHAYVAFEDGGKEATPVSFIQNFPTSWRLGWNKQYLYKIFWSPNDDDSPREMLKRCAEIPIYEKGSSLEKPGYYRGAVVLVKDSEEELNQALEGKRPQCITMKFMNSSFDKGLSKKKVQHENKAQELVVKKNLQVSASGVRQTRQCTKKKGINLEAQRQNTSDVRNTLKEAMPNLFPDGGDTENSDVQQIALENTNKDRTLRKRFHKSEQVASDSNTSSSNDECEINLKKYKIDPDFTPKKHEELKQDLIIQKGVVTKLMDRNFKLQDNLNTSEEKNVALLEVNSELKGKVTALEQEIKDLKTSKMKVELNVKPGGSAHHKISVSPPRNLFSSFCEASIQDINPENEHLSCDDMDSIGHINGSLRGTSDTRVLSPLSIQTDNPDTDAEVQSSKSSEDLPNIKDHSAITHSSHEPGSSTGSSHTMKNDNLSLIDDINCIGDISGNLKIASDIKASTSPPKNQLEENSHLVEIIPGCTVQPDIAMVLDSIQSGERKDLRFIKDLCIIVFGPEVLASSTIFGTARGGRKKQSDGDVKKKAPLALDAAVLKAIRKRLIERVAKEENMERLEDPDKHPRTTLKRFHEAVRGAQKRCRDQGYGTGTKNNQLNLSLLRE